MKPLITIITLAAVATLLTGFTDQWKDQTYQIGKTSVSIIAAGSDERWILALHRSEALKMKEYANTYNNIVYNGNLPQTEICAELERTAIIAIQQREKSFVGLHEVKCTVATTGKAPELKMTIYPQVRFDYRFIITFIPTN